MIIAIDGPAASGKGTIAKQIATVYGLHHLDTGLDLPGRGQGGARCRPFARRCRSAAIDAAIALDPTQFDESALKAQAITEAASVVAAIPEVRQALMNYQREFATQPPGRGARRPRYRHRHRARRRREALRRRRRRKCAPRAALPKCAARGEHADEDEVLADLLRRDERDSRRSAAPLKAAPDAHLLDTTHLGIDAAFRAAVDIIEAVRTGRKRG